MKNRKVLFLTGTRADFGKMKPLMRAVDSHPNFKCDIFITGMHTLQRYGYTADEVTRSGFSNIFTFMNQHVGDRMEMILATTINGLSRYVNETRPDMLVIHGDRVEALSGAIVGALTNTLVCHIEGGERSGTIDESIRHSVSKLAHLHLVCNDEAVRRLIQMGERQEFIHNIGSPDIDVMLSSNLPSLNIVKSHYDIDFDEYGVVLFHPVTTDINNMQDNAKAFVDGLLDTSLNYVVVYPNNDEGTNYILHEYKRFNKKSNFKIFPSIEFESFLTLLKNSKFIVGNSSAGIREMPFYGLPSINVGDRQNARYFSESIINVDYDAKGVKNAIEVAMSAKRMPRDDHFGNGNSTEKFIGLLENENIWHAVGQKLFNDVNFTADKLVDKVVA